MAEEWRKVPDFPNYDVSNLGRVRSYNKWVGRPNHWESANDPQRILSPGPDNYGYLVAVLSNDSEARGFGAHAIVAAAFIGPRPDGHEVCHKNGIAWDNRVENLYYATVSENRRQRRPMGTGYHYIEQSLKRQICETARAGKMTETKAQNYLAMAYDDLERRKMVAHGRALPEPAATEGAL